MGRRKLPVAQPRLRKDARGLWQVTWTDPLTGKTVRRGCGTRNRRDAEKFMPQIVEAALSPPPPSSYTLGDLLDAYVAERIQRDHSKTFRHAFTPLGEFFGALLPDQLKDATYERYRRWRTKQKIRNAASRASKKSAKLVSDTTAVRELNALRGAIAWGQRNHWKGLEGVTVHLPDSSSVVRFRYLSRTEVGRLLTACIEPHTKLFVLIAIATGARMSAILELRWNDVAWPVTPKGSDPEDTRDLVAVNIIDFPDTEWKDPKTGVWHTREGYDFEVEMAAPLTFDFGRGRGNKRRGPGTVGLSNIPLYESLVAAYKRRKSHHLIEWRGKKVAKVDLTDAYRRANIADATQHTLKHTCCSWLVQAGIPYERIAKLVGTSAKTIEKHYGHLSPEHLATVGNVLTIGR